LEQGSVTNNNNHKIAVLGGGSFGTIIANMLAVNGHATTLWMRSSEQCEAITSSGENAAYLPGYQLHASLQVSTDMQQALAGVDTVFFAVPSSSFRSVAKLVSPWINSDTVLISAAKGIEADTFLLPSQILEQELPDCKVGVISGPNLAKEIANSEITATVNANHDRYGVELAGALKNIYAIVAGIAEAMKVGQNTKSVVLTRSLAEMSRFASQLGADPLTFLGLSGVGDLYVTCSSPLSRNFRIGLALGQGKSLDQAIADVGQVAEGVNTTKLVKERADKLGIYMPLASALYAIMFEQRPIIESLQAMMVAEQNTDVEFMVKPNE
jgi:glycerol-3-phosphate dehydrogenase (NAD(P)+)